MEVLPKIRDKVDDMKPLEAVDYLLGVVEELFPALAGIEHQTDKWGMTVSPSERLILCALVDAYPRWMSYGQLRSVIAQQGDPDNFPPRSLVKVHVCRIRQRLSKKRGVIETLWGRGYRFIPHGKMGAMV